MDGFHRHRVGKEIDGVKARFPAIFRLLLPIQPELIRAIELRLHSVQQSQGKYKADAMSEIVFDLKEAQLVRCKDIHELGMDPDEVSALGLNTGLPKCFPIKGFLRPGSRFN